MTSSVLIAGCNNNIHLAESILMTVYSSANVPGTEFIALGGSLPSCLNGSEPHVIGTNISATMMRPALAVIQEESEFSRVP